MTRIISSFLKTSLMGATLVAATALAATPAVAQNADKIFNYKGADRQQMLEKGAKKEGKVTFYSALIVNQALRPLAESFEKKYPYIDVEYWRGNSSKIIKKVLAEKRAKNVVGDIASGSGLAASLIKGGAAASFQSPETAPYSKQFVNPLWASTRFRTLGTAYNSELVKNVPKTYEALVDPKYKGKLSWNVDSPSSGAFMTITILRLAWGDKKSESYLKKLAQIVKPIPVPGSNRTVANRVVEGEYWIGVGASAHHPIISKLKGAPTDTVMMSPTPLMNAVVMLVKGTKHPHSAMLLADYLISAEGQKVYAKAGYLPAHPKVSPKAALKAVHPQHAGVQSIFVPSSTILKETPKTAEVFKKYFK